MGKLIFKNPPAEWVEGLPIGNGRIGLMAWGTPGHECFSLNADTLFRSNIKKSIHTAHLLPRLRALVLEGNGVQADTIFQEATRALPTGCNPYQPFADLLFLSNKENTMEYSSSIDLSTAIAETRIKSAFGSEWLTMFASAADQVIVLLKTSEMPESFRMRVQREHDPDCQWRAEWHENACTFTGRFIEGTEFSMHMHVETDGSMETQNGDACITGARRTLIRIALSTGFECEDPRSEAENMCLRAGKLSYDALLKRHTDEYSALYGKMHISLGNDKRSTWELYEEAISGKPVSPKFCEQIFAYARYLMISSSRPGSLPINLQGLWCHDLKPMWDCGYTTDMNVQMAYWMAETANLSECHIPLFDWIDSLSETMETQAKEIFGAEDAAYIPQYTDAFMTPTVWRDYGPFQVLWSGAAAWLAAHYYEHWQFTGDTSFARERAFPFMKKCMNLYIHLLTKNETGKYILAPSCNPENWASDGGQLVHTSTMDLSLIRELAGNLLSLNEELGIGDPMAETWREIGQNLAEYPIDENGVLREWHDAREPIDPMHRHLSHLYGVFPSHLFEGNEALNAAALKAIDKRLSKTLEHSAAWSFAWYACLFAHLGLGERAMEFFTHLIRAGMLPNLLVTHCDWRPGTQYSHMPDNAKIFQIDALLGIGKAVCGMLAAEREDGISLLPALPKAWSASGSVSNMRFKHGVALSFRWENGCITNVSMTAPAGTERTILFPGGSRQLKA